ncbi:MAG: DNA alkylation repair protein [Deltaproteobacteria bacterium]|nr:DNA alkylation repair protein [Deltaproteobacteria bacterium]
MPQGSTDAENPAAFKHAYSPAKVQAMSALLQKRLPAFQAEVFSASITPTLTDLEMKARVDLIARALRDAIPLPYPEAIAALVSVLGPPGAIAGKDAWGPDDPSGEGLTGFAVWPVTHFVSLFGRDHHADSMAALESLTRRFTAEFALRPFLEAEPERTLAVLRTWATSPDQHLRRAASESTRPRLPWGIRLRGFVADPTPVLALIEPLRTDPEEYVRRSVANNLNDIGKDHPQVLVEVAERWWAEGHPATRRLVKHALRSLVKAGHPGALGVLGFSVPARVQLAGLQVAHPRLVLGETQVVTGRLQSQSPGDQRLVVDYRLHLVGAKGRPRTKVFKGTLATLSAGAVLDLRFALPIRKITTRRYYSGLHAVEVLVCGAACGRVEFELTVP